MSQDAIERALTELAERADTHLAPDVVRSVRRRVRRYAAVRTAAATAAVATVAAGISVLAAGGSPFDRTTQLPVGRPTGTPSGPYLTVELHPDPDLASRLPNRQPGVPAVVEVVVRGNLPTGQGWPVERSVLGVQVDWGDGTFDGQGADGPTGLDRTAAASCPPAGQLRAWERSEPMTHHYDRPGTYTVTYRALVCGVPGEVTKTVELTVTAP